MSLLIKDTTREERIQIIRKALQYPDGCEESFLGTDDAFETYRPYIDGKMEIRDINLSRHTSYGVH
jgi:hypothetical protein